MSFPNSSVRAASWAGLLVLLASTASAQQFQFLPGIVHSLDVNDFDIRTSSSWDAYFSPINITSSGVGGHFSVTEPTEVLLTALGSGDDSSFTITDVTRPPQTIVVNFSGGNLSEMLTLSNSEIYNLGASAFSKSGSMVQFSMVIVPEPAAWVLMAIGLGIVWRRK